MSKRAATRRQVDALREQSTMAERLRIWRDGRRAAADDRRAKRAKAKRGPRGVDRVPQRYRVDVPAPVHLVKHEHPNYRWRRNRSLFYGSGLATGKNVPYINPARDAKPGARLRRPVR